MQGSGDETLLPRPLGAAALKHIQSADDRCEQVVEVMGHAACELPHRLHLLGLAQGLFGLPQRLGLSLLLGDVTPEGIDKAFIGRCDPRDVPIGPIRAAIAVLVAG